jgi:putative DNA primase/helicase
MKVVQEHLTGVSPPKATGAKVRARPADWELEEDLQKGLSDVFNARQLADRHGVGLRYCYQWKRWLFYDGMRWTRDESGEVERRAKETIESFYQDAELLKDSAQKKRLREHALRSESAGKISSMIELARSEPGIAIAPEELDRDPWLLNVRNGTLDLRTGKLRGHNLHDSLTRIAGCDFAPEAACPTFQRFLDEIFCGNAELIRFAQKAAGYSLSGSVAEQVLFIEHGSGRNGKSTLNRILHDVMGEYAASTPSETLLARYGDDGPSNDLARLYGIRFVSAIEAEDGRRLAEARIKQLTGGDRVAARFLYGEFFEFEPQFKIWLATNHKPTIRGTDEAIWRRIRLVPFDHTVPEDQVDPDLLEKLRQELPGILAWAVKGCLRWQQDGLSAPEKVRSATEAYREEEDLVAAFIRDRCATGPGCEEPAGLLFKAFKGWCEEQGEKGMSATAFGRRLSERGFVVSKRAHGKRFRNGIRLMAGDVESDES